MNKMVVSAALVMGLVAGSQAYSVTSNFGVSGPSITTDHVEYTLVVGAGETVSQLMIGYFAAVAPITDSFYVNDGVGSVGGTWGVTLNPASIGTQNPAYVAPGTTQPGYDTGITGPLLSATIGSGSLNAGTYYFGYAVASATYNVGEVAFGVIGSGALFDNWSNGVDTGTGPVYGVVPEPTSFALLGLGAAVLALRRRVRKA